MTQQNIIEKLTSFKLEAGIKYPIHKIGLFGSWARGEQTINSDIDIVVEFNNEIGWEYFDFTNDLKNKFQQKVDVVSINAIPTLYWNVIKNEVIYA